MMFSRIFIKSLDNNKPGFWYVGINERFNIMTSIDIKLAKVVDNHTVEYLIPYLKKITPPGIKLEYKAIPV